MLIADKRDYRNGYKKHFGLYKKLKEDHSYMNSRNLLLTYSVESGLKYLLLGKWCEDNPEKIMEGNDQRKKDLLKSHNLEKILKELGQQGNFKFPQLKTIHNDMVAPDTYHQFFRYCIRIREGDQSKEKKVEEVLNKIAEWIEEGM